MDRRSAAGVLLALAACVAYATAGKSLYIQLHFGNFREGYFSILSLYGAYVLECMYECYQMNNKEAERSTQL